MFSVFCDWGRQAAMFFITAGTLHLGVWPWALKDYHDRVFFFVSSHCADNVCNHKLSDAFIAFRIQIKMTEVEGPARNALGPFIVRFSRYWPSVAAITQNIKHLTALRFSFPYLELSSVMLVIFFFPRTFLCSFLDSWLTRLKRLSASMLNPGLCCHQGAL